MAGPGIGPQIPPEVAARLGIRTDGDATCDEPATRRAIGPSMPPSAATQPASSSSSNDDDDGDDDEAAVGPAADLAGCSHAQARQQTLSRLEAQMDRSSAATADAADESGGRGEWMLVPPSRRGGDELFDESWTLTPEERAKRAAAQRAQPAQKEEEEEEDTPAMRRAREEDAEKAKFIDEFNRTNRPKSLLEMHHEAQHKSRHPQRTRDARAQGPADEWRRTRHDRDQQRAVLDAMGALGDKYTPGKGGAFHR
ncbi:hypothetical protein H4R19_004837 [Coemansia spiralis]|nr:hypothetical protein H4R19_004837 [Coemansia spiralis]